MVFPEPRYYSSIAHFPKGLNELAIHEAIRASRIDQLEIESHLRNFAITIGNNIEGLMGEDELTEGNAFCSFYTEEIYTTNHCEVCGNHSNNLRTIYRSCLGSMAACEEEYPTCYGTPLVWRDCASIHF